MIRIIKYTITTALAIITTMANAYNHNMHSLAPMLDKVSPTVVNITVLGQTKTQVTIPGQQGDDITIPTEKAFHAVGSGVIINAQQGYVITNAHVIKEASTVNVVLNDGRAFQAEKTGIDAATDIAILKIPPHHLKQISIGEASKLRVGDFVTAIGNPFGLHQSVTSGVVSALHRDDLHIETFEDFIQTDAPINPGNSGGALVNQEGQLVGINTAIFSGPQNRGNIGIGFAIPVDMAMQVAGQLIKHHKVNRGLMGIMIQKVTPALANTMKLPSTKGALVSQVQPHSPADKGGIKPQDFITNINKTRLMTSSQLRNTAGMMPIGSKVDLTLYRHGKPMHKSLIIASPQSIEQSAQGQNHLLQGVQLRRIDGISSGGESIQGVGVDIVQPNSLAWMNGLRSGDIILELANQKIHAIAQIKDIAAKHPKRLLVKVYRGNSMLFIGLEDPK
jgi:Do/DeqQ family serine protease